VDQSKCYGGRQGSTKLNAYFLSYGTCVQYIDADVPLLEPVP